MSSDIVVVGTSQLVAIASLEARVAKWSTLYYYLFVMHYGSAGLAATFHPVCAVVVNDLSGISPEPIVLAAAAASFFDMLGLAHLGGDTVRRFVRIEG